MKILHLIFILTTALRGVSALFSGFALESKLPNGQCRTEGDWEFAFNKIAEFPAKFKNARLFVSSECNTLANAVPAALKTGTTLVVGIWTEDDAFFTAEKQALLQAIQQFGAQWIIAVLVGSEDISRSDTDVNTLAIKVFDVRGMVRSLGVNVPVGHADTAEVWVNATSAPLIAASDFLGVNNYPYWKGFGVEDGTAATEFFAATDRVRAVAQGKDVWTSETGQPITGEQIGSNIPSLQAQQIYWWLVACEGIKEMNFFYYDLDDFQLTPRFSVVDATYKLNIDMTCVPPALQIQVPVQIPATPPVPIPGTNITANSSVIAVLPQLMAVTFSAQGQLPTVMPVQFVGTPVQAPQRRQRIRVKRD